MKKTLKIFSLLIAICSLLTITTCSDGSEDAAISISLNHLPAKAPADVSISQLEHVIVLSGPTGEKTLRITGSGTARATVVAGLWNIRVTAYYGSEIYAIGSAAAEVRAGRNTDVSVKMTVVWNDSDGTTSGGDTGNTTNTQSPVIAPPVFPTKGTGANLSGPPTETGRTHDSITVAASLASTSTGQVVEYAKCFLSDGSDITTWQENPMFAGLTEFGTYYFYARSKGNTEYNDGMPQSCGPITVGDLITSWADLMAKISSAGTTPAKFLMSGTLQADAGTGTIVISGSKDITLLPNGNVTINRNGLTGQFFNAESGNLTLGESGMAAGRTITLNGAGGATASLIVVGTVATSQLKIYDNVVLQNNAITGNGGAVLIDSNGTFDMYGGTIKNNSASSGGGVYNNSGTFNMQGGTIGPNEATGTVTNEGGGGVYTTGTFAMSGGEIIGNKAESGGGVYAATGFTMSGGTIGPDNTARDGGGVYFWVASGTTTFAMSGNATITGNIAQVDSGGANGGGVVITGVGSTDLTMKDYATISFNKAISPDTPGANGAYGGGVYFYPFIGGDITMDDFSSVSNNEAIGLNSAGSCSANGGGVYFSSGGTFTLNAGSPKINNNTVSSVGSNARGGGINISSGDFIMDAGEISGNKVQGPDLPASPTYYPAGGGVYLQAGNNFEKNGGTFPGDPSNMVTVTNTSTLLNYGNAVFVGGTTPFGCDGDVPDGTTIGPPPYGWDF